MKQVAAALAILILKAVTASPAMAVCSPRTLADQSEDMLIGGAPVEVVLKSMDKHIYFDGEGCWYETKGYVLKNAGKYPRFNALMQSRIVKP